MGLGCIGDNTKALYFVVVLIAAYSKAVCVISLPRPTTSHWRRMLCMSMYPFHSFDSTFLQARPVCLSPLFPQSQSHSVFCWSSTILYHQSKRVWCEQPGQSVKVVIWFLFLRCMLILFRDQQLAACCIIEYHKGGRRLATVCCSYINSLFLLFGFVFTFILCRNPRSQRSPTHIHPPTHVSGWRDSGFPDRANSSRWPYSSPSLPIPPAVPRKLANARDSAALRVRVMRFAQSPGTDITV